MTSLRALRSRPLASPRVRLRLPLSSPSQRVWLLTVVLTAGATLGLWLVVSNLSGRTSSMIPWPLVALGMYLAEVKVVDVHFRRESHSFSLSEIPAVIGLFTLTPTDYVVAATVGPMIAFVFPARQPFIKAAFNGANYALIAVVVVSVFHLIAPDGGVGIPGLRDWVAALIAMLTATLISTVTIAAVITISGGAPQFQKIPDMLQFGGLVALANTSIGLLAITVVDADPAGIWLLAVPVTALFLAYRAYVSEREKKERLELLYHSSRILQHSPELDSALVALLDHARDMFRSERADCVLFAENEVSPPLLTRSRLDADPVVMSPTSDDSTGRYLKMIRRQPEAFMDRPAAGDPSTRQAMIAPLAGERQPMGYLAVANRLGEASTYGADDLRLLETIAGQVAVALQNGQLEQSLTELSALKDELRHQAYHDSLTKLGNRVLFTEAVDRSLAARSERTTVVLFLDLDNFKAVNDTLGHSVGDELLSVVAERISRSIPDSCVAARLGGDEFAILVRDFPDLRVVLSLAAKLREDLRQPILLQGRETFIDVSIGIASATAAPIDADELLRNADVAMYKAKADGKGRVAVFDPTIHAAIVARHALGTDLTRGLLRNQFELYYQPLIELRGRRIVGFEALLRWHHADRGLVTPDEFIQVAEETGSIVDIGRWVLLQACQQGAAWASLADAPAGMTVSVNVSPRQLQDSDFVETVQHALRETGLPPDRLIIEVTETAMIKEGEATGAKLEELRCMGARVALDDFGTGYASLSHLRRFPVDIIKIARDFVVDPDAPGEDWAFAAAIIALARTLGLQVVAEGIEQPGQAERLEALGCALGQGYYLGLPAAVPEIDVLLGSPDAWEGRLAG